MMNDYKTFVVTKKLDGYQKGKCFWSVYLLLKTVVKLFHDTITRKYQALLIYQINSKRSMKLLSNYRVPSKKAANSVMFLAIMIHAETEQ